MTEMTDRDWDAVDAILIALWQCETQGGFEHMATKVRVKVDRLRAESERAGYAQGFLDSELSCNHASRPSTRLECNAGKSCPACQEPLSDDGACWSCDWGPMPGAPEWAMKKVSAGASPGARGLCDAVCWNPGIKCICRPDPETWAGHPANLPPTADTNCLAGGCVWGVPSHPDCCTNTRSAGSS